ncbi:hypothetical protein D3C75_1142200 [compost metagenome]
MRQQPTDGKRQDREEPALPAPLIGQEAERCALVVDMHQVEEGGDLHPRIAKRQQLDHGELARLVQHESQHRQPEPTQARFVMKSVIGHVHQAN